MRELKRREFLRSFGRVASLYFGLGLSGCLRNDDVAPKDPAYAFLEKNPDLGYGFNQAQKEWFRDLYETVGEGFEGFNSEYHETMNAKIRQEQLILGEKLGKKFVDVKDIVGKNWRYTFDLYKSGKSLMSLDSNEMRADFPNREDREIIYRGMWMPYVMMIFDVNSSKFNVESGTYKPSIEVLKNNLKSIVDGTIRDRIMRAHQDPEYKYKSQRENSDQSDAWRYYRQRWEAFAINPDFGFTNTGKMFGEVYDPLLKEKGGRLVDLERFVYGLSGVDSVEEPSDVNHAVIYAKAIGGAVFEQRGNYPDGRGYHQAVAMPVQKHIVDEIKSNPSKFGTPIIGPGQTISVYCAREPLIADKVSYVGQVPPTSYTDETRLFELWSQKQGV